MRYPGTGAPWGEGWGPWGQLYHLSLVLGEAEVSLQPRCWAWTPPQLFSTSLPSRNEAVGAEGVAKGFQSSALTSPSCPGPHRSEPHLHQLPLLHHSSGASPGAPQPLQLCWQLRLSLSCVPPVLCAPLSCSSQQHPNKRPREEPVPRTVTSWSAPPWAASATGVCPCLGCAEGMLGGCSGPHHLLWEPSPARGQQGCNHGGSCAVVPVQGQGRAEGNSPCLGPQRAWTWGHPGEHLPFSPASWEITQGPQGRKSWSHNPASHPQGLQGWEKNPFPCPSPAECIPRGAAARAGPLPTQPAPLRETGGTGGAAGSRIWGDPRG